MTDLPATFGNRRVPRMLQKVQAHRELVRASGSTALEASWDDIEQFLDFLYAEVGRRDSAAAAELPADCIELGS